MPWQATSHRDVCNFAGALAAMYMIGAAADLLRQTAAYAGVRTQFGAPIGTFQASNTPWPTRGSAFTMPANWWSVL